MGGLEQQIIDSMDDILNGCLRIYTERCTHTKNRLNGEAMEQRTRDRMELWKPNNQLLPLFISITFT